MNEYGLEEKENNKVIIEDNINKEIEKLKNLIENENAKKYIYEETIPRQPNKKKDDNNEKKENYILVLIEKENNKLKELRYSKAFEEKVSILRNLSLEETWYFHDFKEDELEWDLSEQEIEKCDLEVKSYILLEKYKYSYKSILAMKDDCVKIIHEVFRKSFANKVINIEGYIIYLYYLFFDKFVGYYEFIKICGSENVGKVITTIYKSENHEYAINKYKEFILSELQTNIINEARVNLKIHIDHSIASIGNAYKLYYHYLSEFSQFVEFNDKFLRGILNILDTYKELDYRNELDFWLILNYVINNEELVWDKLRDKLSFIVLKSYSGSYFDYNNEYNRNSVYIEFPVYTNTNILKLFNGKINSDVVAHYNLGKGKDRMGNKKPSYEKDMIYEIYVRKKREKEIRKEEKYYIYKEIVKEVKALGLGEVLDERKIKNIIKEMNKKINKKGGES